MGNKGSSEIFHNSQAKDRKKSHTTWTTIQQKSILTEKQIEYCQNELKVVLTKNDTVKEQLLYSKLAYHYLQIAKHEIAMEWYYKSFKMSQKF